MKINLSKIRKNSPTMISGNDLISEEPSPVDHNQVVEYLVGLSDSDFSKMCEVARIYRKAEAEAAKAIGHDIEPTNYAFEAPADDVEEDPVEELYGDSEMTMLDEDDETGSRFLDDEDVAMEIPQEQTKKAKGKK